MKLVSWVLTVFTVICGTALAADTIELDPLDRVLGNADAPLTVIEYASMTCPHCARFHEMIMPTIKAEWIDTGKVKLIYRDLPTNPVNMAVAVGMITQCAPKEQYFPILSRLFKTQEKWMSAAEPLSEIKRTVGLAGITPGEVDACLKRDDLGQAIQTRANKGARLYGIQSTPTLVVDGKRLEGEQPYADFKKALEEAYAKATKK